MILIVMASLLMSSFFVANAYAAQDAPRVIKTGGLKGDALYAVGGDQQQTMISMQHLVLSKSGAELDYHEYDTIQDGFEALRNGEIDLLYPMTPYERDLEPLGLVASDPVYVASWNIIFTGDYSSEKLKRIAVPGGRLAPFYCREVFPGSELVPCDSRLGCLDAVIDGRADSAVFNGFQTENIVQNGTKYGVLTYTVLPTDSPMVFVMRKGDDELLAVVNDCIANTSEAEKTDYMVESQAVAVEESTRIALFTRYRTVLIAGLVLIASLVIVFAVVSKRVLLPLQEFNRCMNRNGRLPEKGAKSLRKLASTYNRLYGENIKAQELLRIKAEHDELTGLLNRHSYEQCLEHYEKTGEPYMLVLLDLDRFKEANDTYGHAEGDQVLKKFADLLKESFRSDDCVCRIGGDEFAVVAADPGRGLVDILQRKIDAINEALTDSSDGVTAITVSAGAAMMADGLTKDDVYHRADEALYRVKANGRGGLAIHEG